MDIIFFWNSELGTEENSGALLSGKYKMYFNPAKKLMKIESIKSYVPGFLGNNVLDCFAIVGENGSGKTMLANSIMYTIRDKNGIATFTLRVGKYTYQEYDAPEGYMIDEGEYPFEIKEDGEIVKASMTNEKEPAEEITTPKTGDESNVGLWFGLAGVSLIGLGTFGYLLKKKQK